MNKEILSLEEHLQIQQENLLLFQQMLKTDDCFLFLKILYYVTTVNA